MFGRLPLAVNAVCVHDRKTHRYKLYCIHTQAHAVFHTHAGAYCTPYTHRHLLYCIAYKHWHTLHFVHTLAHTVYHTHRHVQYYCTFHTHTGTSCTSHTPLRCKGGHCDSVAETDIRLRMLQYSARPAGASLREARQLSPVSDPLPALSSPQDHAWWIL